MNRRLVAEGLKDIMRALNSNRSLEDILASSSGRRPGCSGGRGGAVQA